jgi:hypothetical protein
MVGEPVVIAEPSFLEGESSPAVLERFVSQSRKRAWGTSMVISQKPTSGPE